MKLKKGQLVRHSLWQYETAKCDIGFGIIRKVYMQNKNVCIVVVYWQDSMKTETYNCASIELVKE